MQHYQSAGQVDNQRSEDAVNRLLRHAEISRLTRNLKSKLAHASSKTQKTPDRGVPPQFESRRRSKTLEGASPSPRPMETPFSSRSRSISRRSSMTSGSPTSSIGSAHSVVSPRERISRISSVNSIPEAAESEFRQHLEDQKQIQLQQHMQQQQMQHHLQQIQIQQQQQQHNHEHEDRQLQQRRIQFQLQRQYSDETINEKRLSAPVEFSRSDIETTLAGEDRDETINDSMNAFSLDPMSGAAADGPEPPSTPPPLRRVLPRTPERGRDDSTADGASLLLHFAHSPGCATPRTPGRATPHTPDFNMSDYLHFQTPSPARGQLTPRGVRWGSLNSALFSHGTGGSLAPPAVPNLLHRAGPAHSSETNQEG